MGKKLYETYEIEDFVQDDQFIDWCIDPDNALNIYWENWLEYHPDKQNVIQKARDMVLELHQIEQFSINEIQRDVWAVISRKNFKNKVNFNNRKNRILGIAATFTIILLFSFVVVNSTQHIYFADTDLKLEWLNYENNTGNVKLIELSDGSKIFLEPFSSLKYPVTFEKDQRTVCLKGEAFFDISHDEEKPFLVYANETITKVLGTSFRILAFEGEETVEVEVQTGKVAVYAKVASVDHETKESQLLIETDERIYIPRPNKKLEVTPNQKVIFNRKKEALSKTISPVPKVIGNIEELSQFEFKDAPVAAVFEVFEQAYGIEFKYNDQLLKNCTINTTLDNESLFVKLDIICTALGLKFKIENTQILIDGAGC